jgi:outer membrane protein OmpA-like peptidoglycan-associated protein
MLSFYLRGISFTDLAYLKPSNIIDGRIEYKRIKTHKNYSVKLFPEALSIIDPLCSPDRDYLLPILANDIEEDSVRSKLIEEIDSTSDYQDYKFMTLFHPSGDIVIEAEFERELQLLGKLLQKRPDWAVVIRSHTDSKGSEKANVRLSEERAGFLSDYLNYLNVNQNQIIIEGLGEAFPLNHCFEGAPCTEEELSKNRRTELVVIKGS